jgi:hypothetical protein
MQGHTGATLLDRRFKHLTVKRGEDELVEAVTFSATAPFPPDGVSA